MSEDDRSRALEALHAIPPDWPRDEWHKVGRAAIAAGLTIDDLNEWSAPAHNYKGESDVRSAFRTVTKEGGTGPGTLFAIAREHGYTGTQGRALRFSRLNMARPANHQRDEAIAALRELTAQHGAKEGARLARERFPGVPAGTWGRWRQQAVGNVACADAQALNSLAAEVRRSVPQPEAMVADPVPATRRALDF